MLYQNFIMAVVAFAAVLSVPATNAHPGEMEPTLTLRQLERRQAATNARHAVARNCDSAIAAFEGQRRAKRSAFTAKRHVNARQRSYDRAGRAVETTSSSATSTANVPTYTALQNVGVALTMSAFLVLTCDRTDHLRTDTRSRRRPILYRSYIHHPHDRYWLMSNTYSMKS
jgi:hypothetical protein